VLVDTLSYAINVYNNYMYMVFKNKNFNYACFNNTYTHFDHLSKIECFPNVFITCTNYEHVRFIHACI